MADLGTTNVDSKERAVSTHGEWLNVSRKRRGKNANKPPRSQDNDKKEAGLDNKFAALNVESEEVSEPNSSKAIVE
ncbi:leucine-rich repeat and fibronectin type III domain-containing [Sesbania bispinosa]|nr:leucine-rich repeat and fibronectin type III domain-containing [Sesbania bispinosa]